MLHLFPYEELDKKALDQFYVWGWADDGEEKIRNLPSPKLAKFLKSDWMDHWIKEIVPPQAA